MDLTERLRNPSVNANVTVKIDGNWVHFNLIERLRNPSVNANFTVNPFGFMLASKVANFAQRFYEVLQKRVLLGIGMRE